MNDLFEPVRLEPSTQRQREDDLDVGVEVPAGIPQEGESTPSPKAIWLLATRISHSPSSANATDTRS
jgi:hypothetical protein